jgi:F420-dependent oxidoreductase-like protein
MISRVRLALMIEGQEGVTWEQWLALARACEESGIDTLFRSDHYVSQGNAAEWGSLDAWTTIAALAAATTTLRFGTLVSPVTFRHPSLLAKAAATADEVSGGRIELGIGAGWMVEEHEQYGFPFPEKSARLAMLAEQIEIVHRQWTEESFSFDGEHYRLRDCRALPKPVQRPHPPILVGGDAYKGTTGVAARWADEYNTPFATSDEFAQRRARVHAACEAAGREPLPVSLMTSCVVGADQEELETRARRLYERRPRQETFEEWERRVRSMDAIYGTVDEASEQLRAYADAGCARVMLQHLLHDDVEAVRLIGRELVPAVA